MPQYCLVKHHIVSSVIDGPDPGNDPDTIPISGDVTFYPILDRGDSVVVTDGAEKISYILAPISARIVQGKISVNGEEGVKLFAGGPDTNPERIRYRAKFTELNIAGVKRLNLKDILFEAVPGGEMELSVAQPVPGAPYPGYSATIEQGIAQISDVAVSYLELIEGASDDALGQVAGAVEEELQVIRGPNLLTRAGGQDGVALSATGELIGAGDRWTSDFIPVEKTTPYVWSRDGQLFTGDQCIWQQYRADKSRIGGLRTGAAFTTDIAGAFVRASILKTLLPVAQLEQGAAPTPYVAYGGLKAPDITLDGVGSVAGELDEIRASTSGKASTAYVDTAFGSVSDQLKKFTGVNLLTRTGGQDGASLVAGGGIGATPDRWVSDFIPLDPSTPYVFSIDGRLPAGQEVIWQQYRSDKTLIGGLRNGAFAFTSDGQGRFLRATVLRDVLPVTQLEKGDSPTAYVPFGALTASDVRVGATPSLTRALARIESRLLELEGATPTPPPVTGDKKAPDGLLVWEAMPHNIRRMATAYDGNLYGQMTLDGYPRLCRSTDSGATFEPGWWIVDQPFGPTIATWTVWEDGSVTAIGTNGKIYRQDAFDAEPRLVYQTTTGNQLNRLTESTYSDGAGKRYMFAAEYDHSTTQKMVYYSLDAGETWDILKAGDIDNRPGENNHWHAVQYDPYRDAVWLSQGDGTNSRVYVTFDWGDTWHSKMQYQPTSIFPFDERVIFGRDEDFLVPGITGTDATLPLVMEDDLSFRADRKAFDFYPNRTSWNNMDDIYYLLFVSSNRPDEPNSYIWATGDGAKSWHPVYTGPIAKMGLTGIDKNGYLFATKDDYQTTLYRAKALGWRTV